MICRKSRAQNLTAEIKGAFQHFLFITRRGIVKIPVFMNRLLILRFLNRGFYTCVRICVRLLQPRT